MTTPTGPRRGVGPRRGAGPDVGDEVVLRLPYRPPYHWEPLSNFLATRALPGVERVDSRGYTRTVRWSGGVATVGVRPADSAQALELRIRSAPSAELPRLSAAAARTFDLAADPEAISAALGSDPLLAPLVALRPGLRIPGAWDPFECAVRAVLGQQVTVAAGRTLAARLVQRVGSTVEGGSDGLTHCFPSPAELVAASLDGLGLTGARINALRAMAGAVLDGRLDFSWPAREVAAAMVSLPGFGDWTAQYVALRALGDADAFPSGDLVLQRMAAVDGSRLTARLLAARAEAWRPWRGYAVMHLWQLAAQTAKPVRAAARNVR